MMTPPFEAPVQPTPEPDTGGEVASAVRECEHYYAWMSPAGAKKSARICMSCHWPDPAWLNHLAELDLGHDDCVHCEFGDQHVSPATLAEAVKAERERLDVALIYLQRLADRWSCNCGGPSPEGHHEMHCTSLYGHELRMHLRDVERDAARTAPLQDAEEVGEC